ncbi:MAG: Gfo/Idh/MocA family oxidoreductase [Pirellulales bacterium]|nr:Gfo/Idh/MocA family oxidoreductase [Pirellulales bacterium]
MRENTGSNRPTAKVDDQPAPSRRSFIKGGGMILAGGAITGGNLAIARGAHAFGSDVIRIGLVGCGSRGTAAATEALATTGGEVRLVAMADVFSNNLHTSYRTVKSRFADRVQVDQARFVGLDAYQQVMQSDADLVILATPPGFRPPQFEAAVHAGKHVFMEKPVATDAIGVRRVLAAGEVAKQRGLAVQVGLQRRHQRRYQQCIERLQGGEIGELIFARVYWNRGQMPVRNRTQSQTELEYQLRNWCYFNWLSGDLIGEQHIHNLDVINWLKRSHPVEAQGQGGRGTLGGGEHGQVFDHHLVEYTYADGFKMFSQCRQSEGCWNHVGEHVHGSAGSCDISGARIRLPGGKTNWRSDLKEPKTKAWQLEQDDLFAALRGGQVPNEVRWGAESTMTAILGRLASYSGKVVRWQDALADEVSLANTDAIKSLQDPAPVVPDPGGNYRVPRPGEPAKLSPELSPATTGC